MNNFLMLVAIISVLIGLLGGGLIVFLLFTSRKKILANSLTHSDRLSGRIGTVQIPFDCRSRGKISLYIDSSIYELVAFTDYPHSFQKGDPVLIVQIRNAHAWVVPGNIFDESL